MKTKTKADILDELLAQVEAATRTLETTPRASQHADPVSAAQSSAIFQVREFLKASFHSAKHDLSLIKARDPGIDHNFILRGCDEWCTECRFEPRGARIAANMAAETDIREVNYGA